MTERFEIDGANQDSWMAVLAIAYPGGITKHPSVLDHVEKYLAGRGLIIDIVDEGVRVAYGLDGETEEVAKLDDDTVVAGLLAIVGLSQVAIVQRKIIKLLPLDEAWEQLDQLRSGRPNLSIVPDHEDA